MEMEADLAYCQPGGSIPGLGCSLVTTGEKDAAKLRAQQGDTAAGGVKPQRSDAAQAVERSANVNPV